MMQLHVDHVRKTFGGHRVLDGISLRFDSVQTLALVGPSGGGKSTFLRILAGLEYPDPDTGCRVEIDGERVVYREEELIRHRRTVGTVFQAYNLFPHLSALQNVTLPLEKVHGLTADAARETAMAALRRFRLETHSHKRPAELSGGQRQRVAIARAIAIKLVEPRREHLGALGMNDHIFGGRHRLGTTTEHHRDGSAVEFRNSHHDGSFDGQQAGSDDCHSSRV